jgi:hypothetical protein
MKALQVLGAAATVVGVASVAAPAVVADPAETTPAPRPAVTFGTEAAGGWCMWGPSAGQSGGTAYAGTSASSPCTGVWVQLHYKSGGVHRARTAAALGLGQSVTVREAGTYLYSCHAIHADGGWHGPWKQGSGRGDCGSP